MENAEQHFTERVYYSKKYQQEILSSIIDVKTHGDKIEIILSQTIFFPEGGGQPGDIGWLIRGEAQFKVENTIWKDNHIIHVVDKPGLQINDKIIAKIDWNQRFEYMQIHTAQHILSASFLKLYDIESGSIHFGKDTLSLDLKNSKISTEQIEQIEIEANNIITQNLPVETHTIQDITELKKYPIRGQHPKIKPNDPIRLVEVTNYDYSPCGGLHVNNTGEIGIIKILKIIPMKELSRIEFVCGQRALREWQSQQKIITTLSTMINANGKDTIPALQKMQNEYQSIKTQIKSMQLNQISNDVKRLYNSAIDIDGYRTNFEILKDYTPEMLKTLANTLTRDYEISIFLATPGIGEQQRATVIYARHSSQPWDMNQLLRETIGQINGKGGGKPEFAQGMGESKNLSIVIETVKNIILSKKI